MTVHGNDHGKDETQVTDRIVYLLEVGCYDDRHVVGVFLGADAAMAAHSPERPRDYRGVRGREYGKGAGLPWSYEWSGPDERGCFSFGADWNDAADITPYDVQGEPE